MNTFYPAAAKKRKLKKSKGPEARHLALPYLLLQSEKFIALSPKAVKLLCDIGMEFNGFNNGNLSATWSVLRKRGWVSKDTLNNALQELLRFGMIEKTRQGGLHQCSLFALTWRGIDPCKVNLECKPSKVPSGLWRGPVPQRSQKSANSVAGAGRTDIRVSKAIGGVH